MNGRERKWYNYILGKKFQISCYTFRSAMGLANTFARARIKILFPQMDRETQWAAESWSHALWSLALWRGDNVSPQFHSLKAFCHRVEPWLDWWSEYRKIANLSEIKKGQRNQVMNRPLGVLTGSGMGIRACLCWSQSLPPLHISDMHQQML